MSQLARRAVGTSVIAGLIAGVIYAIIASVTNSGAAIVLLLAPLNSLT